MDYREELTEELEQELSFCRVDQIWTSIIPEKDRDFTGPSSCSLAKFFAD